MNWTLSQQGCLSKQLWRTIDSTLHCIEIKGTNWQNKRGSSRTFYLPGLSGLQHSGLTFGFRKHFPNKLDTVPFSTNFYNFSDHRPILLKILWKYPTRVDETTTSNCTVGDKPQRFIWKNQLEKLYTETLEKELRSIKWKDFNELQINKIENINVEIED